MKRLLLSLTAGALLASAIPAGAQEKLRLNLQNAFPTANPLVGTTSRDFVERVRRVSNGAVDIRLHEPGALVPALETFDAVSAGSLDMGWSVATNQSGRDPTFNFFGSVPFGPGIGIHSAAPSSVSLTRSRSGCWSLKKPTSRLSWRALRMLRFRSAISTEASSSTRRSCSHASKLEAGRH